MRTAFIRGLWGDRLVPRSRIKIIHDLENCINQPLQLPFVSYSFGRENTALLRSVGIEPIELSRLGIVNFFGARRRDPTPPPTYRRGQYVGPSPIHNFGVSMWRHKLMAMEAALQDHDQIVWLDWDAKLLRRLPHDFWEHIAAGAKVQASLRQYHRIKCPWRRSTGRRLVPGGAFVAIRGHDTIRQLLELQAQHPKEDDEITYARWVDLQQGGWHGEHVYRSAGFEPWCYRIRGQLFPPSMALFTAK